ncbi:1-(5-phosphoribosyl)-5-[(5-phosphoribosylamino)methylideneamino] imidazole-4-carboxamide isomerase [Marinoscillum sp. MHG1-6]|uniref:1-(5-phosphoribosyl)-5-[(5- phosphoribosylamino)methylideneamino]imidazole-4- carboxamide isomerase n=1 Tax=Marinoscillum sp. MHG1-6 TaxID=2959627 RepID=UPI0021579C05|nr:1-(5-phosphoribosyl)-5-[(5-phosphoribosylamino)methylideneamino] imidazole-4-carboxamide isomerase [Marinoscillum sp. MHG1-6]
MWIVPSITVTHGRTIRLTQGDPNSEKAYDSSPLDLAEEFLEAGITRIHLVDMDGATKGDPVNLPTLEMLTAYTDLKINFAGGLHTDGAMTKAFECGAKSITAATIAVYNKELFTDWIMSYGRDKIVLAADTLHGKIRVGGWQKGTEINLFEHVQYFYDRGLKYLKTTDISKDGLMSGPSFELYTKLKSEFPDLNIFASGGVRNMDDILKLEDTGVTGVIFGKAYYEGNITLKEIENYISSRKLNNN